MWFNKPYAKKVPVPTLVCRFPIQYKYQEKDNLEIKEFQSFTLHYLSISNPLLTNQLFQSNKSSGKKLDISSLFSNSEDLQKKWNNCLKIFHIQLDEDINLICGNISNNTLLGTHGLVQDDDKIEKKIEISLYIDKSISGTVYRLFLPQFDDEKTAKERPILILGYIERTTPLQKNSYLAVPIGSDPNENGEKIEASHCVSQDQFNSAFKQGSKYETQHLLSVPISLCGNEDPQKK